MTGFIDQSIAYRQECIDALETSTVSLPAYSSAIMKDLRSNTGKYGIDWFLDLLRISSFIPECVTADSSEEKRYSKYTDTLLAYALEQVGLNSLVLDARSDAADVEALGGNDNEINMVGDAKVFRLSRTAKNQKDFKIASMDKWKNGKPQAMLVCPIYQLPASQSQIYNTAETSNVCIFSYSHLCVLIRVAHTINTTLSIDILKRVFDDTFSLLTPSKSAANYWYTINKEIVNSDKRVRAIWNSEKSYISPSIEFGKKEGLAFYQRERARLMSLSHAEAIQELVKQSGVDKKINVINSVAQNNLFTL